MNRDKIQLFRKKALESLSKRGEHTDLIRTVSLQSWLLLITTLIIIIAVVLWTVLGTVPTRVNGDGMLLAQDGTIYSADAIDTKGQITAVKVISGKRVKQGEIVATIKNIELEKNVQVSSQHLIKLQQQYQHYKSIAKKDIKAHKDRIHKQNTLLQKTIKFESEHLVHTKKLLDDQLTALKKGIESRIRVNSTRQTYYSVQRELENARKQINQNLIIHSNFVDKWHQRLRNLELKIKDTELELNKLQERLKLSFNIKSPVDGIVISVHKGIGDHIKPGDTIVTIASAGKGLDAVIFISPKDGKRIKVGMPALIVPNTVNREEFGSIRGKVIKVSNYPITQNAMIALLHNEELVKLFAKDSAPILVRVRLLLNSKTYSGYDWTSSQGPRQLITPGTLVNGRVVVRRQAPITLMIPTFKKILGHEG